MRAFVPDYELVLPKSLTEALALLQNPAYKPFAGGTDLMVLLEAGKLPQRRFVSLWGLPELKQAEATATHLTLGALTTYTDVRRSATIAREFPLLAKAASETGGIATQNRGTLGGNIANASPAADSPPALLVYDAELELRSHTGARWVPYSTFHTGYKTSILAPGEIIARIRLPRRAPGWHDAYRKVGTRRAQAISKVCFAGGIRKEGTKILDARFALGSVAPQPLRCISTERALIGGTITAHSIANARRILESEITPISDIRSDEAYRRKVAGNLLEEFLRTI